MTAPAVRVLIVDDSALVRRVLTDALALHADIEVVGTASDPYVARERIAQLRPDVMTLDIEMPRMDGLSFLSKVMRHSPMPVIVVSSLTTQHSATAVRALALGAVDVLAKPSSSTATAEMGIALAAAIRVAAHARVVARDEPPAPAPRLSWSPRDVEKPSATDSIIALGASTGGTQALEHILRRFPADAPGTVIVQHLPAQFTGPFAARLDALCAISVREARDGEAITTGVALVAPGGRHLLVQSTGRGFVARVKDGPMVHHQRPAVDVLFQSVARAAGQRAVGVLLTGMGADGAKGLLAMRSTGAHTIAQDERTCVVFGMPREAINLDAAEEILPLDRIADAALAASRSNQHAK